MQLPQCVANAFCCLPFWLYFFCCSIFMVAHSGHSFHISRINQRNAVKSETAIAEAANFLAILLHATQSVNCSLPVSAPGPGQLIVKSVCRATTYFFFLHNFFIFLGTQSAAGGGAGAAVFMTIKYAWHLHDDGGSCQANAATVLRTKLDGITSVKD